MFHQTRAFRLTVLIVSAVGAVMLVCLLLFLGGLAAEANTGRTEPRTATPIEIATAALEGQIEALRKAGFDETCLYVTEMYGKLCIEQCVSEGTTGFYLQLYADPPRCTVKSCTCEDPQESGS
jgi:hypothetical protein